VVRWLVVIERSDSGDTGREDRLGVDVEAGIGEGCNCRADEEDSGRESGRELGRGLCSGCVMTGQELLETVRMNRIIPTDYSLNKQQSERNTLLMIKNG
jgi:hypothetical protein